MIFTKSLSTLYNWETRFLCEGRVKTSSGASQISRLGAEYCFAAPANTCHTKYLFWKCVRVHTWFSYNISVSHVRLTKWNLDTENINNLGKLLPQTFSEAAVTFPLQYTVVWCYFSPAKLSPTYTRTATGPCLTGGHTHRITKNTTYLKELLPMKIRQPRTSTRMTQCDLCSECSPVHTRGHKRWQDFQRQDCIPYRHHRRYHRHCFRHTNET